MGSKEVKQPTLHRARVCSSMMNKGPGTTDGASGVIGAASDILEGKGLENQKTRSGKTSVNTPYPATHTIRGLTPVPLLSQ